MRNGSDLAVIADVGARPRAPTIVDALIVKSISVRTASDRLRRTAAALHHVHCPVAMPNGEYRNTT